MIGIKTSYSHRELMWFGPLFALFAVLVRAIAIWRFEAPGFARWIGLVSAAIISIYYAVPLLRKPIFIAWLAAVFPIGWVVSHLLLGVVFYLVVFPIGLSVRLFGYDALRRRREPEAESYWIEREPRDDPRRYFRQF